MSRYQRRSVPVTDGLVFNAEEMKKLATLSEMDLFPYFVVAFTAKNRIKWEASVARCLPKPRLTGLTARA